MRGDRASTGVEASSAESCYTDNKPPSLITILSLLIGPPYAPQIRFQGSAVKINRRVPSSIRFLDSSSRPGYVDAGSEGSTSKMSVVSVSNNLKTGQHSKEMPSTTKAGGATRYSRSRAASHTPKLGLRTDWL